MVSISPCTVIWLSVVSTIMYMLSCGFDAVCVVDIYVAPWLIGFLTRGTGAEMLFPPLFTLELPPPQRFVDVVLAGARG